MEAASPDEPGRRPFFINAQKTFEENEMRSSNRYGILTWGFLSLAICPLALAGPNCDKDPPPPSCSDGGGGGGGSGTVFEVEFTGAVSGGGWSNPTENTGKLANLVFNKLESEVWFTINVGSNICDGSYGFPSPTLEATMHVLDGEVPNADTVAVLWFSVGDYNYKLELFEEGLPFGWENGKFPPFEGGKIYRYARYWEIGKPAGPAGPCVGLSGTFNPDVKFILEPLPQ